MAIAIYTEVSTGRQHYADATSKETQKQLAAGRWVLFDATPDDPAPAGDPLDNAVSDLLAPSSTSKTAVRLRAASVAVVEEEGFARGRDALRVVTAGTKTAITATTRPSFMDRNGALLRGGPTNKLERSTDGGATWTTVYTFTQFVASIRQMDNGELLVALAESGANKSVLMVSTNYESGTLTFTQRLTASNLGQAIELRWSGIGANGIYAVNEYDSKAAGSRSANQRAWLTQDSGATWTQIYDHGTGSVGTRHIHGVIYDQYRNAVWMVTGDYATAGDGARQILVSWDRGATWTVVSTAHQPTAIFAFPDCVIFGSDSVPNGVLRIDRPSTTSLVVRLAYEINKTVDAGGIRILTHVAEAPFRDDKPGSPLLLPFTSAATGQNALCLITTDGYAFGELWRSPDLYNAALGPTNAVGPTPDGKVILSGQDSGGWFKLVVDLPTPGLTTEAARVTRHMARAIPKRAYLQLPNQSTPSFQSIPTGVWTELLLSLAGATWTEDVGGLFTPSPDGLGVIVNREAIVTVTVDSALAGLATSPLVAVGRAGIQRVVNAGTVITAPMRCRPGDRISGMALHSSGANRTVTGTSWGLVLDAVETY